MVFKILDSNEVPQVGKRKQLHPRNCFLHLAALQQEGVITEAALLLAMVGLQQALVARGAALPPAHPGEPGAGGGAGGGALPGAAALVEGEETDGWKVSHNN